MKTSIKKWAGLAVMAVGFLGCSPSNDSKVMTDDTGKSQGSGVTPPNAIKDSGKFAEANKGPMGDAKNVEKYKQDTK